MTADSSRRALVTGAGGQLGRVLVRLTPSGWHVVACDAHALDVTRRDSVETVMDRERPSVVFNLAAYTGVDAAEADPARAEQVNVVGAAHVAQAAAAIGARTIYVSTDFVFDGAQGRPYTPSDPPNPLGVYGRTKLAGEREVARVAGADAVVVRTAWLHAAHGRNFVLTVLRAMAERPELGVVSDQVGTPTSARSLAEALWALAAQPESHGILHWTDAGVASRYDLAVAVQEEALELGLLARPVPIRPLRTEELPTPARRPLYSVLDKRDTWRALGLPVMHWRVRLRETLAEVVHERRGRA